MRDAERALAMNPNDANAYHVRGKVLLERGDKKGLNDLEHAASLSARRNARVLHDLASAYAAANRQAEALAAQREAASLRPDDPVISEQLAELVSAAKAQEKAPAHPGR
jgi:tetratricopeptide (TPR) repeat protein